MGVDDCPVVGFTNTVSPFLIVVRFRFDTSTTPGGGTPPTAFESPFGLVDENIDGREILLGVTVLGAVTIFEWNFVRLVSFPLFKFARRCLVSLKAGLPIFAMRSLLGRERFILRLIYFFVWKRGKKRVGVMSSALAIPSNILIKYYCMFNGPVNV